MHSTLKKQNPSGNSMFLNTFHTQLRGLKDFYIISVVRISECDVFSDIFFLFFSQASEIFRRRGSVKMFLTKNLREKKREKKTVQEIRFTVGLAYHDCRVRKGRGHQKLDLSRKVF